MKFAAIAGWVESEEFPIDFMCRELEVSRSGYYAWRGREASDRAVADGELTALIRFLFDALRGNPGVRRIRAELAGLGHRLAHKRVHRLMRAAGLQGRHPKPWKRTTVQGERPTPAPDLLGRDFTATAPNQRWVGDITYVKTWDGWVYVATVIDLFSRRLVGWAIDCHMRTTLVTDALAMAITHRQPEGKVLFHSDQGTQGGFQGSSQHLDPEVECDVETQGPDGGQAGGGAAAVGGGSGVACADAFSWPAGAVACGGARVLAADRHRGQQRGRGCRDRRVNAGGGQVVSTRWRDVADQPGRAHRPLSVVR